MNFDEWIYKVCECMQRTSRKEITEIYSSIDLTEARYAFLDNIAPENFEVANSF